MAPTAPTVTRAVVRSIVWSVAFTALAFAPFWVAAAMGARPS